MWTARSDLNLHASCCNFVKNPSSPLFNLINAEYHENWLLAMLTTNYIEQHWKRGRGGSYQSGDQRQADVTLSLESPLST